MACSESRGVLGDVGSAHAGCRQVRAHRCVERRCEAIPFCMTWSRETAYSSWERPALAKLGAFRCDGQVGYTPKEHGERYLRAARIRFMCRSRVALVPLMCRAHAARVPLGL